MQVFYVNIGGGEPTVRPRLLGSRRLRHRPPCRREVLHQRHQHHRRGGRGGWRPATTSTSRSRSTARPRTSTTRVRGPGSYAHGAASDGAPCRGGVRRLQGLGGGDPATTPASSTRSRRSPTGISAQLRLTRLRPSGRGADVWDELHPTAAQQRALYDWLLAHGERVLTGDSFFHLAGYGESLPGLNLCGAGRVVCLIDPVGDVYACPFAIHDAFLAGNVRDVGGFARVWRSSELFAELRRPSGGACTSCSRVRRLPGRLHGGEVLHRPAAGRPRPGVCARSRPDRTDDGGGRERATAVSGSFPSQRSGAGDDRPAPAAASGRVTRARWRASPRPVAEMWLADLAWPDVAERAAAGAVLAVPLGSTEQHGPHLPLSTDTDIAVALCGRLASARSDVLIAPAVAYGSSGEHDGFAGTLVDRPGRRRAACAGVGPIGDEGIPARALRVGARRQRPAGDPCRRTAAVEVPGRSAVSATLAG